MLRLSRHLEQLMHTINEAYQATNVASAVTVEAVEDFGGLTCT